MHNVHYEKLKRYAKIFKKKKKRVTFPCVGKVIELYVEPSKCHFTDTLYFYVSCVHRHILKN